MIKNEYVRKLTKQDGKGLKTFKISNSFGVYDAYKSIRKHKWYDIGRPLTEHEFYTIVRKVNDCLADNIAKGETVTFPAKMGRLELRKSERGVKIVDGKLKVTYPVDWESTLNLWVEDEEARKAKTLIRFENEFQYYVKYKRYYATYENKTFYEFQLNRFVKRALRDNINKREVDTVW